MAIAITLVGDSIKITVNVPPLVAVGLLMQTIVQLSAPQSKIVVPPHGLGGFRNLPS